MSTAAAPRSDLASPTRAVVKNCVMGILLIAVLGLPSGRIGWTRAWLYVALTLASQLAVVVSLYRRCPDLLAERSRIHPGTKSWDKFLAPVVGVLGTLATWLTAAFDVRFHWPPPVPASASALAFAGCALGIFITYRAMLVNRFFSATVRIQHDRGHAVIDRGPYARLRHPGYTGAALFTLASPAALGSLLALIPALLTFTALVVRTALEDRTLHAELPGYREYAARVRYRLVPGLW